MHADADDAPAASVRVLGPHGRHAAADVAFAEGENVSRGQSVHVAAFCGE